MSLYSANRTGRLATAGIVANENYSNTDIGRILYETQVNDMAIFEAMIASDLREAQGIKEGTLLEAEVDAMNNETKKSFFTKIKEALKAFWAKIKGVFQAAMRKFSAYILKDGKAFVKDFDAKVAAYKKQNPNIAKISDSTKVTVKGYRDPDKLVVPTVDNAKNTFKDNSGNALDRETLINKELAAAASFASYNSLTPSEFRTKVGDYKEDKDMTITALKKEISEPSNVVSEIKKAQKEFDKAMAALEKELNDAEKNSDKVNVANISVVVSSFQQVSSIVSSSKINVVKANMSAYRSALMGTLKAEMKHESVYFEDAAVADEETLDEVINGPEDAAIDADIKDAVNDVIDSVASEE